MEVVPVHVNQTAQVHAVLTAPAVAEAAVLMAAPVAVRAVAAPDAPLPARGRAMVHVRGRHE